MIASIYDYQLILSNVLTTHIIIALENNNIPMKVLLGLLLLFFLAHCKLYQVVSLSRHGARYHVNSAGGGDDTKPLWGQLTAVGMKEHENFGKILRKEYIDNLQFLSPTYNSS